MAVTSVDGSRLKYFQNCGKDWREMNLFEALKCFHSMSCFQVSAVMRPADFSCKISSRYNFCDSGT